MMKVLAAEMSDPSRLRRGKQYAKDGSVLDIIIEPGIVTGEIQGSRSTPYIASIEVIAGDGMPLRRDITTTCTCPDDDNWDGYACKHVVATMFVLSDEFLLEPELLDVWRDRDARAERSDDDPDADARRRRRAPATPCRVRATRQASATGTTWRTRRHTAATDGAAGRPTRVVARMSGRNRPAGHPDDRTDRARPAALA